MKLFLYFFFTLIVIVVATLCYWQSKFLRESEFPAEGIQDFEKYMKTNSVFENNTLKIISWNIGYASGMLNNQGSVLSEEDVSRNLQTIAQEIKMLDPDILFLQEVDFKAKRSHFINQFEFLANHLQMPYGAYVSLWNKMHVPYPYWPIAKQFGPVVSGQAVLSRLPMLSQDVVTYDKPPNPIWYNWFYLDRVLERMRVKWLGQELGLWNVHHEAFHAITRLKQTEHLAADVLKNATAFKIVAGDFNDPSKTQGSQLVGMAVESTFHQFENDSQLQADDRVFSDQSLTFPSHAPIEKLDHVFISPNLKFKNRKVICTDASDHCLIYVEIEKIEFPTP